MLPRQTILVGIHFKSDSLQIMTPTLYIIDMDFLHTDYILLCTNFLLIAHLEAVVGTNTYTPYTRHY